MPHFCLQRPGQHLPPSQNKDLGPPTSRTPILHLGSRTLKGVDKAGNSTGEADHPHPHVCDTNQRQEPRALLLGVCTWLPRTHPVSQQSGGGISFKPPHSPEARQQWTLPSSWVGSSWDTTGVPLALGG